MNEQLEKLEGAMREAVKGMSEMTEKLALVGAFCGFHADDPKDIIITKASVLRKRADRAEAAEKELEFVRRQGEAATAARIAAEAEIEKMKGGR